VAVALQCSVRIIVSSPFSEGAKTRRQRRNKTRRRRSEEKKVKTRGRTRHRYFAILS